METTTSKQAEVALGESHEQAIADAWAKMQDEDITLVKSGQYHDFDYWVFDKQGILICYLEVKKRRKPLSTFGDAMFPTRKHHFAQHVWEAHNCLSLAVTEYACGTLVEVDLAAKPSFERNIKRRDRPEMKPVPHVFYDKSKMKVLRVG